MLGVWQYITAVNDRVPSILNVVDFLIIEIRGGSHGGMLVGEFWGPLQLSLTRYGLGLLIGVPLGALLGLLIGASRPARGLFNDTVLVLLALPTLVWAFLASIWLGISDTAPIVAVILTAVPLMAINVSSGVRSIDTGLVEMSTAFKTTRKSRISSLLIGGALPSLFSGLRLSLIGGWNSLLIVEWFGITSGVGARAKLWYDAQRNAGFLTWILIFVVFIILLDRLVLNPLERRVLPAEARSEVHAIKGSAAAPGR